MTLKDMIDKLRIPCWIKIRDSESYPICDCESDSHGVIPYLDLEIVEGLYITWRMKQIQYAF